MAKSSFRWLQPGAPARTLLTCATFALTFLVPGELWAQSEESQPDFETFVEVQSAEQAQVESAQSIQVVETSKAKRRPSDLGSLLARERGVALRRFGGLGSPSRISIDGLSGTQVPVLIDGIPVEFSAFSSDPSAIPTNLVRRLEIYRGIVPARFGADALGAAVNIAFSSHQQDSGLSMSYQLGSFDTHRASAQSHIRLGRAIFVKAHAFADLSRNDYLIPVEIGKKDGSIENRRIHRANADYRGFGGGLTLGVLGRRWADRLSLSTFYSSSRRAIPHNIVMTVPHGSAFVEQSQPGFRLGYEKAWGRFNLQVDGAGTLRHLRFSDSDPCVYDWFGTCILEKAIGGEILGRPIDQRLRQPGGLVRATLGAKFGAHQLQLVSTTTAFARSGKNRLVGPEERDPAKAQHRLFRWLSGLEYRWSGLNGRFENIAFVKSYSQWLSSLPAVLPNQVLERIKSDQHTLGLGDSLRFRVHESFLVKAGYEWTTRLASVDEILGDGSRHVANLELLPERSHNLNLEFRYRSRFKIGSMNAHSTLALRDLSQAIAQIPSQNTVVSQNVVRARAYSADLGLGWEHPDSWVFAGLNASWVDSRNRASEGPFMRFRGDRMPAQPWLRANANLGLRWFSPFSARDEFSLDLRARYVHPFFRGWESAGSTAFKQQVPRQWVADLDLVYQTFVDTRTLSLGIGVYNIFDSAAYDYVGVALVSRSIQSKISIDL